VKSRKKTSLPMPTGVLRKKKKKKKATPKKLTRMGAAMAAAAAAVVPSLDVDMGDEVDDDEDIRLHGLNEMKAYIDRIDRRLFDRYGTPPRSKLFE
jgi:hypothetical protein